eukprot:CAMPEP_0171107338 /NCGR_PEP_ID=MMETSP0766_2-20121228/66608_1 /TAXON_ID=439317 /ORGANISM="Gambierdiscus australes, Strain CAWD 149" /LENGTH=205 /DNA_ID=CAMNT_0011568621 /DNA_START=35 /DNA_END=654 /DNA_ORIENTATION=+
MCFSLLPMVPAQEQACQAFAQAFAQALALVSSRVFAQLILQPPQRVRSGSLPLHEEGDVDLPQDQQNNPSNSDSLRQLSRQRVHEGALLQCFLIHLVDLCNYLSSAIGTRRDFARGRKVPCAVDSLFRRRAFAAARGVCLLQGFAQGLKLDSGHRTAAACEAKAVHALQRLTAENTDCHRPTLMASVITACEHWSRFRCTAMTTN